MPDFRQFGLRAHQLSIKWYSARFHRTINNYWMRLSMISWIIKTKVCVICRSWRLGQITQTRQIMRKPNSIFVLLYIFHIIHPHKQKRSVQPFCFWGEYFKGLSNQADVELDMISAISAADIAFIMSSSQAIRFSIVSLMYNNIH